MTAADRSSHEGMRYGLIYQGNTISLGTGKALIGRSVGCKVVLTGAEVSRRHARVEVTSEGLVVEDLGSTAGVFVNGERVERSRLSNGDQLLIGTHELRVVAKPVVRLPARPAAGGNDSETRATIDALWDDDDDEEIAASADDTKVEDQALLVMLAVVDGALASGNGAEAEKTFSSRAEELLGHAKHEEKPSAETIAAVVRRAVRIGTTTGRAKWVDYALQLAVAARTSLPDDLMGPLEQALDKVGEIDKEAARKYVAMRRGKPRRPSLREFRVLQRLDEEGGDDSG